jgi:hypothetical protein
MPELPSAPRQGAFLVFSDLILSHDDEPSIFDLDNILLPYVKYFRLMEWQALADISYARLGRREKP